MPTEQFDRPDEDALTTYALQCEAQAVANRVPKNEPPPVKQLADRGAGIQARNDRHPSRMPARSDFHPDALLTTKQLAGIIAKSKSWLEHRRWLQDGQGPVWHKMGRSVRYRWGDVLEWMESVRMGRDVRPNV